MNNSKQHQVNITPEMLQKGETVLCACGNMCWEKLTVMKKIPGLLIGMSQAFTANVEVMRCSDCKEIFPEHLALIVPPPIKIN